MIRHNDSLSNETMLTIIIMFLKIIEYREKCKKCKKHKLTFYLTTNNFFILLSFFEKN